MNSEDEVMEMVEVSTTKSRHDRAKVAGKLWRKKYITDNGFVEYLK